MLSVICRKNGSSSKIFTDGKVYFAFPGPGNILGVLDDWGNTRYILLDSPSPHLVKETGQRWPYPSQKVVGFFETVNE